MNKVQELALRIYNASFDDISKVRKLELLTYISKHEDEINQDNGYLYFLLDLCVNNPILPSKYVTAILLSTHFNVIINPFLTSFDDKNHVIVFDVSPFDHALDYFNAEYTYSVRDAFNHIDGVHFSAKLRICDGFNNTGEVAWFNPFSEGKEMSVKWGINQYTVRDLKTTIRMCSMARNIFADYVTAPVKVVAPKIF